MRLRYKTSGKSKPERKPRVYFSCHPDDFEAAFPLITEDILSNGYCVIWYDEEFADLVHEPEEGPVDDELPQPEEAGDDEFPDLTPEEAIKEMRLVVFAVTSKFLHEKNRAKDLELPLALENHIPVLPIMLENGLGGEFSNTCAKIQVVSKYVADPTATPYEEVLKTYLDSVLVGKELAERVKTAFDAYVFLSYRKKDREHAKRLIHLIHEKKEFRDIAIWFDEYLVPGERFNDAIRDAFEKSSLFAMAVTPHLTEDGNYVMRVEYPLARDREEENAQKEKNDFAIVPVELYTDKEKVGDKDWRIDTSLLKDHEEFKYKEIPDLKNEHRKEELDETLLAALDRIAKKANDGSAEHKFFIGLAYLNRIDVETDQELALELITEAAKDPEKPCMDATAKLVDMYFHGECVDANTEEAITWQKLLVSQYKSEYDRNHDPDEHKGYGTSYFKALRKLSDLYVESGDTKEAIRAAEEALSFCAELEQEVGIREQERDKALILNCLGSLHRKEGELTEAEECFVKANRIYVRQAAEIKTQRILRDLSISYERLGDICREKGDYAAAEEYYQKAREIREKLLEASPGAGRRRDLSAILTKLGNVKKSCKEYEEAARYYTRALAMDKVLAQEVKTPQAWDDYGVSLIKIGDILKAEKKLEKADGYYTNAEEIFAGNVKKTDSEIFKDHLAGGYEKLASVKKKLGDLREAKRLYLQAIELRTKLYIKSRTVAAADALATAYYNAALFLKDRELMNEAHELWKKISVKHPRYAKYRDKAEKYVNNGF